jgi:hypothetical protein
VCRDLKICVSLRFFCVISDVGGTGVTSMLWHEKSYANGHQMISLVIQTDTFHACQMKRRGMALAFRYVPYRWYIGPTCTLLGYSMYWYHVYCMVVYNPKRAFHSRAACFRISFCCPLSFSLVLIKLNECKIRWGYRYRSHVSC